MDGTTSVVVGERGRLVLPASTRARRGIEAGTTLVLLDTEEGIVLFTREQLRDRVRRGLQGAHLVESLLTDRRQAAAIEDQR